MKQIKSLLTLVLILVVFSQCNENQTLVIPNKIELSASEQKQISEASIRLTSYWASVINNKSDFMKLSVRSSIQNYVDLITDHNEKAFNQSLLENEDVKKFIAWYDLEPSARAEEISPLSNMSQELRDMTDILRTSLNDIIESYVGTASNFNEADLSLSLQVGIRTFENEVNSSISLSEDDKRILLINTELQYQSIDLMVATSKAIFDGLGQQEGGRTAGFWRKLGNIVASVVVHAVVVALVVAAVVSTAGVGGWLAAPLLVGNFSFITGGIALGGGIGSIIGGVKGAQGQCLERVWSYTACN